MVAQASLLFITSIDHWKSQYISSVHRLYKGTGFLPTPWFVVLFGLPSPKTKINALTTRSEKLKSIQFVFFSLDIL